MNYENEDCPVLLLGYLRHLRAIKNNAKGTVNDYYIYLRIFFRFYAKLKGYVPENVPFEEVRIKDLTDSQICAATEEDIRTFLYYIADDRNNTASTRRVKLGAVKGFYKYLMQVEHLIDQNPAENVEMPSLKGEKTRQPIYLTIDQSKKLLASVRGEFRERDYLIIALLLGCGMRLDELTGINLKDVSESTILLRGKGNKQRTAYLNSMCKDALAVYMKERSKIEDLVDKDALIVSKRTKCRLGNRQVEKMLHKNLLAAGLENVGCTPHKLRHTNATILVQSGVGLPVIQELLGHESPSTTRIYAHINNSELAAVAENSPLNLKPEHIKKEE